MHSKKSSWKMWLMGAAAAAVVAIPMTTLPAHAEDGVELMESTQSSAPPVQVSGTVEKYYTDRSGLVTAMDLNVAGTSRRVRFAPSWARRLLDNYPVGSNLAGWVVEHNDSAWPSSNLVSIGAERPNRFLTDNFHTGTDRLTSRAWIWQDAPEERVTGALDRIIISPRGEVLAIVLKDGTLVRVPRTVKNQERGVRGGNQQAQLLPGAQVTAWGPQVWQASGDVSIYGQRIASDGLSINGKAVSAVGIQDIDTNDALFGSAFTVVDNSGKEYAPFDASQEKASPQPERRRDNSMRHRRWNRRRR